MISPAKAIVTGALVFALGGAFLIVRPFEQGSSIPGAEPGAEPLVPVYVTGETVDRACEGETDPVVEGPIQRWGGNCVTLKEWSDPRLEGTAVRSWNDVLYDLGDGDTIGIWNTVQDIVTDEGAWRMRPAIRFEFPGVPDISDFPEWWVLDGEDAYEGLSLLLFRSPDDPLIGYVVSTDLLPPAPEPASTQ